MPYEIADTKLKQKLNVHGMTVGGVIWGMYVCNSLIHSQSAKVRKISF